MVQLKMTVSVMHQKAREKAGPLYALFERVRSFIQMFEMVGGAIHK